MGREGAMGGGVSMPAVPLASVHKKYLAERYAELSAPPPNPQHKSDTELGELLQKSLPGIIVFNQIDADHSGSVSLEELKAFVTTLPRHGVPFENTLEALDADGDGEITMEEWISNLSKLPELEHALASNLCEKTGKIKGYVSLETKLAEATVLLAPYEKKLREMDETDPEKQLARLSEADQKIVLETRTLVAELKAAVGSVGNIVFKQIDRDKSGKIDRKEFIGVLKALHKCTRRTGSLQKADEDGLKLSVDECIDGMDVDGDGLIDEDEWTHMLEEVPALKRYIELYVDETTGQINGYQP